MVSPSSQVSSYIDNRVPWDLHAPHNHPDASFLSIREFVLNFPRLKDRKPLQKRVSPETRPGTRELCDIDIMKRGFEYGRRFVQEPSKETKKKQDPEPAEKEYKLDKHGCLVLQKPIYYGHRIKKLDPVTGDADTVVGSIDLDRPYYNPYKTPRLPVRPTPSGGRTLEELREEVIAARTEADKKINTSTAADKIASGTPPEDVQPTAESDVDVIIMHTNYNKELWEAHGERPGRFLITKKKLSELRRDGPLPTTNKTQTQKDEPTIATQSVKPTSPMSTGSSRGLTAELAKKIDNQALAIAELQDGQRELRDTTRELKQGHRELKESHRELKDSHRELKDSHLDLKWKFEKHATKTEADIKELKDMGAQHTKVLEKLMDRVDDLTVQMKEVKEGIARLNRTRSSQTSAKVKSAEKVEGWMNGTTPQQNFASPTVPPAVLSVVPPTVTPPAPPTAPSPAPFIFHFNPPQAPQGTANLNSGSIGGAENKMQSIPEDIDGEKMTSTKASKKDRGATETKSYKTASGHFDRWVDEGRSFKAGSARRAAESDNPNAF